MTIAGVKGFGSAPSFFGMRARTYGLSDRGGSVACGGVERGGSGQFHPPFGVAFTPLIPSDDARTMWFDQDHERGQE